MGTVFLGVKTLFQVDMTELMSVRSIGDKRLSEHPSQFGGSVPEQVPIRGAPHPERALKQAYYNKLLVTA